MLKLLALVTLGLLPAAAASAAVVTYNDRATFTSAASNLSNIDFEAQATVPNSFTFYGATGLTLSGVHFSAPLSSYLFVAAANAAGNSYQWGSGASLLFGSTNEGGNLVITLAPGTFSFGFDLMAEADNAPDGTGGLNYDINVDGDLYSAVTAGRPFRNFFGLISDTSINSVTLTMTNIYTYRSLPIIDNVSVGGRSTNVPAPSSMVIAALALFGLAAMRARRWR